VRLFVAVEVGPDIQSSAARAIEELKRRTGRTAPHARITWVKPHHLHLTIRFIGEVEPAVGEKIAASLAPALRSPAFDVAIRGTGTFPPRRPPRVIWAGIAGGVQALHAVEQDVRARLEPWCAAAPDERDYSPHLTLGRVKNPAGLRPAALLEGLEEAEFGSVKVGAVTLFESRLSSAGPTYVALRRTSLASL
jgi:2'-5' RNA ligase